MSKFIFAALMGTALVGLFASVIAGGMAFVSDTGYDPAFGIVGAVLFSMLGAFASVGLDDAEAEWV